MQQSNGMRRATYNMTSGVQLATWHVARNIGAQHTTLHVASNLQHGTWRNIQHYTWRATCNMARGVQHTTWHVVGAVRGVRPEDPEDPHFDEAGRRTL
jgi:hypothetical protein